MQIFIMRHGEAQTFASSDAERPLTERGNKDNQQMAAWLANRLPKLDLVLVSPYLRAQQTWQDCQPYLPDAARVMQEPGITPYGDSEQVASYLRALISIENPASVLVISHLPLVNYLTLALSPQANLLPFTTSAICQLDYNPKTEKATLVACKTVQ